MLTMPFSTRGTTFLLPRLAPTLPARLASPSPSTPSLLPTHAEGQIQLFVTGASDSLHARGLHNGCLCRVATLSTREKALLLAVSTSLQCICLWLWRRAACKWGPPLG